MNRKPVCTRIIITNKGHRKNPAYDKCLHCMTNTNRRCHTHATWGKGKPVIKNEGKVDMQEHSTFDIQQIHLFIHLNST